MCTSPQGKALLSFSLTQEEVDAREALEWCLEILRHLEEQGMSWLVLFQAVDRGEQKPPSPTPVNAQQKDSPLKLVEVWSPGAPGPCTHGPERH